MIYEDCTVYREDYERRDSRAVRTMLAAMAQYGFDARSYEYDIEEDCAVVNAYRAGVWQTIATVRLTDTGPVFHHI